MTKYEIRERKLSDYHPDPFNANLGTERGQGMIETSLRHTGAGRSLVADKNGFLVAGNKTQEGAVDIGLEQVIEIETEGDVVVVHRRRDFDLLDPDERRARLYAYYDNRANQVSLRWDAAQIVEDIEAGLDLSAMFNPNEIDAIVEDANAEPYLPDTTEQAEPELESEVFIEIYCSRADLVEFQDMLNVWSERKGVTINVS